jgi:hypothetical protein
MIPSRFSSVAIFEKPGEMSAVAKAIADLTQAADNTLSYSVRRSGDVWTWIVSRGSSVIAQGTAGTSIAARVRALEFASKANSQ